MGAMKPPPFGIPAGTAPGDEYEALRADVAARLRNVCSEWSDDDFNSVVDKVTATAIKYVEARRVSPWEHGAPPTR